jgi:uncharacterized protein
MMRPLNVVCYSDGRPGHEKQSRAILAALERITPLSVFYMKIDAIEGYKRLLNGLYSVIFASHHRKHRLSKNIDLILGTGSSTHLPMVGLKMRTRSRLVTCMTPEPWLRSRFDLCLVPRHDRPKKRRNFFTTFGPPCLVPDGVDQDPHKGLILVGGVDPKSHHWDTGDIISRVEGLISGTRDTYWTISSSPRTPSDAIQALTAVAKSKKNVIFHRAEDTPGGWIESAYASHSQVWVTADSVSMIYEALTAGCRVGVLPVRWKKPQNKFQTGIDDLKGHGMVVDFEQWRARGELPAASMPLNEAGRCAGEMVKRWWPKRLA